MAGIRGFTSKPIPAGADARTYRPGIKRERIRLAEARHRLAIATEAAKSPELRAIEAEFLEGFKAAGLQQREDMDVVGIAAARTIHDQAVKSLRKIRDEKIAALPPEKREIGKVDVNSFDFEAHAKREHEKTQAAIEALFPRSGARALEKLVDREARIAVEGDTDTNHDNIEAAE